MNWEDVGKKLVDAGLPLLGSVLPIPGGAAIGQALAAFVTGDQDATPGTLASALSDPAAAEKAREFWAQNQTVILQAQLQAETARILSVNQTMQAEATAQHWPTYSWRPFLGFVMGVMMLGCYFILPLIGKTPPPIPYEAWMALGAVLGFASWGHSKALMDKENKSITGG